MCIWINLKTIKFYSIKLATDFEWQPSFLWGETSLMEQCILKNVNNNLNTNIYSYLETSGGQCSNIYLNVAHFFNTSVN